MAKPYSVKIFVVDGDPNGVKIVDRLNWTGLGIAFPRSLWRNIVNRREFSNPGVYILKGPGKDAGGDLSTVYVGQGEEIREDLDSHFSNKDFWDWAYAFVSKENALTCAHTTWLKHALIDLADNAGKCHLANGTRSEEPNLSECERSDAQGFLDEMLLILPLIGVHVFEKPSSLVVPQDGVLTKSQREQDNDPHGAVVPTE